MLLILWAVIMTALLIAFYWKVLRKGKPEVTFQAIGPYLAVTLLSAAVTEPKPAFWPVHGCISVTLFAVCLAAEILIKHRRS